MRLLIIGALGGQLTTATKLAMDKAANVTHADSNDQALAYCAPVGAPTC
jgi:two-component system, response regulator FlrC